MSLVASPYPGKKRLFEEEPYEPSNSQHSASTAAKRARIASSPSGRCVPLSAPSAAHFGAAPVGLHLATLNALRALFPDMDDQVVTSVLTECGDDIDAAIRRLTGLKLSNEQQAAEASSAAAASAGHAPSPTATANGAAGTLGRQAPVANGNDTAAHQQQQQQQAPAGPQTADQWTDALVSEMSAAKDLPDARSRAGKLLHAFEQFVASRVKGSGECNGDLAALQARLSEVQRENHILKKAVQIQNARMQEASAREQELASLRQLLAQYQERLRHLEMSNYSLALHLQKATDGGNSSLPSHRPPDVF